MFLLGFKSRQSGQSRFGRFVRDDKGSSTVETVLWLPLIFAAFGLMTDATMIFNGHSRVMRIIQDGNRNLSVGQYGVVTSGGITSVDWNLAASQTEDFIEASLNSLSPNATAATSITAGIATSVVTVPATDLEILGMFSTLNSLTLTIVSQQHIEF